MTSLYPWGLSFLSGILCVLIFPRYDQEWLAWIALVPLLLALENQPVRKSFRIGWLAGTVYFLGTLHWVTNTMVQYGNMPAAVSYPLMFLLVLYLGLYVAVFSAMLTYLRQRIAVSTVLTAPVLWVSLEFLRTYALSGFPWSLLGYSQYQSLPVIQISDLTGVYGVSFLLVLINAAIAEGALAIRDRSFRITVWLPVLSAFFIYTLALAYGGWRLAQDRAADPPTLRVGVVQANIPQDIKWDARFRQETVNRYIRLTRDLATESVQLVVWPEAAMPFIFEENGIFRRQVEDTARVTGIPLLIGSPGIRSGKDRIRLSNSVYLLSPEGRITGRYDKMHLVPFGEYIPLSSLLFFVDKMVEGIGNFVPGDRYTVMTLPLTDDPQQRTQPGAGKAEAPLKIATVICFEVIFPDLVRRFVKEGARVMTTITNDAWFGDSAAPAQHFSMVVFRAVENRIAFARAANTGISGFIDRTGRIQKASPIFVEAALAETLRLRTRTTFYTRYGDIFAAVCVIITAMVITAAVRSGRARKES